MGSFFIRTSRKKNRKKEFERLTCMSWKEMIAADVNLPTRCVYIFENSRYNPVYGWSNKGFLPTDRKALSNRDGSDGYNSLEEASEVLASKGLLSSISLINILNVDSNRLALGHRFVMVD
jgi:hypothetical protein